mmetsp:Transcript_17395/g.29266  ORF Transcript_17395/g.29266 Transcript_17395/m.29266 type:complete len:251 (-) Transcript_17395:40-792(-)
MVYDQITEDWVPRFGMGSVKKIEDKYNWVMEEKEKHVSSGLDPFSFKKQEKKLEKEKQDLRELKNKIVNSGPAGLGKGMSGSKAFEQILDSSSKTPAANAPKEEGEAPKPDLKRKEVDKSNLKAREDIDRERVRKRERKALLKSLQLAQISTASMGKFDKKVNKHEPDAPKTQVVKKKKSNKGMFELEKNKEREKDRNLKIFGLMQREKELAASGGVSVDKSKAATDTRKMTKRYQKKQETLARKIAKQS